MIHLGLYTMLPVSHHSMITWRHPRNMPRGYRFDRPEVWQHLAQVIERGCFEFFFSADTEGVYSEHGDSYRQSIRYAAQVPCYDQTILLTYVAAATKHIGIVPTISVNGTQPYVAARKLATLDHLTGGRAGWNVVTAFHKNAAQNLGLDDQLAHDQRYDRADEYLEVCYRLWESWEEGAIVQDVEADTFADADKVHAIDFVGRYFRCKGPLNVERSPQVRPVIAQAGQSIRGTRFAATHAEVVFSIQPSFDGMRRYYQRLKDTMRRLGRDPAHCKVCFSMQPIVGETEAIAREKAKLHNDALNPEAGLVMLSGHLGYDLSGESLDKDIRHLIEAVPGVRGFVEAFSTGEGGEVRTLRDIALAQARGVNTPQVVGTPGQIADWMEEAMETAGGDGFLISPLHIPSAIEDFVDLVVPELQRRHLIRDGFSAGKTFRDYLRED